MAVLSIDSLIPGSAGYAKPPIFLLYGPSGIGKTATACAFPSAVAFDNEDGMYSYDVSKWQPESYQDLMTGFDTLAREEHEYQTLIIDTLDVVETFIWNEVCDRHNQKSIEEFGYGKGYVHAAEVWRGEFMASCKYLRDNVGMTIVLVAHAHTKNFSRPDAESFDRWKPRLHDKASEIVIELCDIVGFANYRVTTVKSDQGFKKRTRAVGDGQRILFLEERPQFAAKSRLNLPAEMPLDPDMLVNSLIELGAIQDPLLGD